MVTFIDTNVLINVLEEDPVKRDPCVKRLDEAKARGRVVISDIVYSEFSVAMASVSEVDEVIKSLDITRLRCSADGLFKAGKAFKVYKEANSGTKNNVLPDFLIGAHAATEQAPLITADARRMAAYFPDLEVIKP